MSTSKKIVLFLLATMLLASANLAAAQQPKKVPRMGFLSAASPAALSARAEAFRQGLRELGYVEGENIVIEWRYAEGNLDRLRELAAELVRLKVDVIVTAAPSSTLPIIESDRTQVADLAAKNRLPTIYPFPEFVEAGGLVSYGVNISDLFRRAATYVDKIVKGAKPADLPVERPTKFELVINLKAAKQIGLAIPPNVLARADKVIK